MLLTPDGLAVAAPTRFLHQSAPGLGLSSVDRYLLDSLGNMFWTDAARGADTGAVKRRGSTGPERQLASLRFPPVRMIRSGVMAIMSSMPFGKIDAWAPDNRGGIVVVRSTPYHVEHVAADGAVVRGRDREVRPLPITPDDRRVVLDERRRDFSSATSGLSVGSALPEPTIPDDFWPATKAPFARFAVRAGPDGTAWVHRAVGIGTEAAVDVFDAAGEYRETMMLPPGAEIIGFGKRVAYVSVPVAGTPGPVTLQIMALP